MLATMLFMASNGLFVALPPAVAVTALLALAFCFWLTAVFTFWQMSIKDCKKQSDVDFTQYIGVCKRDKT